jgi:hypothetical protein
MRRLPSILASGAVAIVVWTSTIAMAQQRTGETDPAVVARRQAAMMGRERRTSALLNRVGPSYRLELMHIRAACGLTREEMRVIRPEADAAYRQAIAGLSDGGTRSRTATGEESDAREVIRKAVHAVVERHVSPERRKALLDDCRLRATTRKETCIDMLVALIDGDLLLTANQRLQIADALSTHWDDLWCDDLEATFAQQSSYARIPASLVEPYLSAAQEETWRRTPMLQARSGSLRIRQGNDLVLDQALGADAKAARPAAPRALPPLQRAPGAVQDAVMVARGQVVVNNPVQVQGRLAADPAAVALRLESTAEEDDPDEDPKLVLMRQRQRQQQQAQLVRLRQAYVSLLDRRIFGRVMDEDEARRESQMAVMKRIDYLDRVCRLSGPQRKKLQVAGQGDIKRFFDGVAEAKRTLQSFQNLDDRRKLALMAQEAASSLGAHWTSLLSVEGSIFTTAVPRTLTDDQRRALEKDMSDRPVIRHRAAVRWTAVLLTRSLGLTDDQRRRLESLLLEQTQPPKKFDAMDYVIVMYQASRIPENRIRPIFDDVQWRLLAQDLADIQRWEFQLRRGGFLPDETFGNDRAGALPPIEMLAPPANRRNIR